MVNKENLIKILKKAPFLHYWVKFWYWKAKYIQAHLFGTTFHESFWQKRHLDKESDWAKNEDWVTGYWNSKSHPHREPLIKKIIKYSPNSILEIGSNCGPNLYLIAEKLPTANLKGIDINATAVNYGNELFKQAGITNVELNIGKADEISYVADKSFDVVFTDATLIYIGPDKIMGLVSDMIRIASKALVLTEWHFTSRKNNTDNSLGIYHYGHWKRNYIELLKQFVPEEKIILTKITKEMWPDRNWQDFGYIIEVGI